MTLSDWIWILALVFAIVVIGACVFWWRKNPPTAATASPPQTATGATATTTPAGTQATAQATQTPATPPKAKGKTSGLGLKLFEWTAKAAITVVVIVLALYIVAMFGGLVMLANSSPPTTAVPSTFGGQVPAPQKRTGGKTTKILVKYGQKEGPFFTRGLPFEYKVTKGVVDVRLNDRISATKSREVTVISTPNTAGTVLESPEGVYDVFWIFGADPSDEASEVEILTEMNLGK